MRYIDADKLQEDFKELHGGKRSLLIDTAPTAAVVEVVRCKDCKHRRVKGEGMTHWYGCLWRGSCNDNDFCNYGERAEA